MSGELVDVAMMTEVIGESEADHAAQRAPVLGTRVFEHPTVHHLLLPWFRAAAAVHTRSSCTSSDCQRRAERGRLTEHMLPRE